MTIQSTRLTWTIGVGIGALIIISLFASPIWPLAGILGIILLLGIIVCLINIRLFPYFILASLLLGQIARIQLSAESSGSVLLIDVANGIYVTLGFTYILATKKRFPLTLSLIFLLGFVLWLPISLIFGSSFLAQRELMIAVFYIIRFGLMAGTLVVTATLFPTTDSQERLIHNVMRVGIVLLILGYMQLFILPDFSFMARYGWDPHMGRMLSTFFDPNFFGMFLVLLFSIGLARLLFTRDRRETLFLIGILLLTIGGIAATFSRSTYLALLISALFILTIKSWRLVMVSVLCISLIGAAIPRVRTRVVGALSLDATAQQRIRSWQETFVIVQDNLVTGVGYNAFGPAQLRYGLKRDLQSMASRGSDSSFLFLLATTGITGFILFIVFLFSLFLEALLLYKSRRTQFGQMIGLAIMGIIPAYVVHSQFVNSLFYPLLLIPFAFIASALITETVSLRHKKAS